jgi:hypothetical protein
MKTMAEAPSQEALRKEFHDQTARINWHELQPYYARGAVVMVEPDTDLVEVALQLRLDNKQQFQLWMDSAEVGGVSDERGQQLFTENPEVWAVVVPPWVLVQAIV